MQTLEALDYDDIKMLEDDEFIASIPGPRYASRPPDISNMGLQKAEGIAFSYHDRLNEGATFVAARGRALPEGFDLITVSGGQFLHHDRHMAGVSNAHGPVEHTWNYIVHSDSNQMLLVEVAIGIFEHIALDPGTMVYFNTLNRHLVSRSDPQSHVVIAQISGFGPDQERQAAERLRDIIHAL